MNKFIPLSPQEAKDLEAKAVAEFAKKSKLKPKDPKVIASFKAIFPFQLFPDELLIYKNKITHIIRVGPRMSSVRDMHFHDIAQVEADLGPIFGHLHIFAKLRTEEPITIDRLSRKEVLRAREIIEQMIEDSYSGKESTY